MGIRDHTRSIIREMAHKVTTVAGVEDPAYRFCKVVTRVDGTADEAHGNVASFFPVLNGKPLDLDVPRPVGCVACINDFNGGRIVFRSTKTVLFSLVPKKFY